MFRRTRSYLNMTKLPNVVVISTDDGLISAITIEEIVWIPFISIIHANVCFESDGM